MTYIHLDTDALDALPPREAYQAATKIHHQAKAAGAAYADRLASDLADQHGQQKAADILGIHQSTLAKRVSRHKKEAAMIIRTYTVTREVPVLKKEISRTWEKNAGVWSTWVDGTRWVLYRNGTAGGWTGTVRPRWEWGPAGSGQEMPEIKATDERDALKKATWYIDVQPAVEGAQKKMRS